ncbi:hypothetical protein [Pseudoalteromonas pernae]|uniref:hypothetical protein n=1 Tax=Pseudoalteromonas pernae TaxID=3118054 RepID=UPI003241C0C9
MALLYTYEDEAEAEVAFSKLKGKKRLASERDATETVYNLFGEPTWGNFYRLGLFNLNEFEILVSKRLNNEPYNLDRYKEIISTLKYVAASHDIQLPSHWL